jgi:hypothetical protein
MVRTKHRIGRYRVIAPIGAGGFSTVYRALDEENDREVAIKVLAENHSMVPDTRRRFIDEFNLRATVNSPFIAKMYEVGVTDDTGQPYMVLELASRGDLRRRVEEIRRSHQVLNKADLMMLARHLTEALTALHEADIVHRDVSPGNILIRSRPSSGARQGSPERGNVTLLEPGERFLLADLGHAKDLIRSSGFTAGGGTQGFAAPEQRDDVTVVDHRADIFSATAIIEWAAHDGAFADDLEPFCDVGLAAEPDERFATMADWYEGISAALGSDRDHPGRSRRRVRPRWGSRQADQRPPASRAGGSRSGSPMPVRPPGPDVDRERPRPSRRRVGLGLAALTATAVAVLLTLAALGGSPLSDDGESDAQGSTGPTATTDPSTGRTTAPVDDEATSSTGPLVVETSDAWAALVSPMERAVVADDLVIAGDAHHDLELTAVVVTVHNTTTGRFWHPDGGLGVNREPFAVDLIGGERGDGRTGQFEVVIPADDLETGEYVIRIWTRGPADDTPIEPSATRTITVA